MLPTTNNARIHRVYVNNIEKKEMQKSRKKNDENVRKRRD